MDMADLVSIERMAQAMGLSYRGLYQRIREGRFDPPTHQVGTGMRRFYTTAERDRAVQAEATRKEAE
jgi:hypothetical protein